jgi:hypothetical protein
MSSKATRRSRAVCGLLVAVSSACGGGPTPDALSQPRVVIADGRLEKRLLYHNSRLNLVKQIVPLKGGSLLIVGDRVLCTVATSGFVRECVDLPVDLYHIEVLMDASGAPATIVAGGLWGKPSVAVLDLNGTLIWRFDGGFDFMGRPVVGDTPNGAVVFVGSRTFDLDTGRRVYAPACGCVASADFDQDGKRDRLQAPNGQLRIVNGAGREIRRADVGIDHWEEPLVAGTSAPFVVLSKNEELVIYDRRLAVRRLLRTPGARFPFHAGAATFLESGESGVFAVLVNGRGGWHRTILYVYSANDELIYEEILDDDYQSMTPYTSANGAPAFFIGGRGEVWSYAFAQ